MLTQERLKSLLSYDAETGQFKWNLPRPGCTPGAIAGTKSKNGYIYISLARKNYLAHRLAWLYVHGSMPKECIDHINMIRSDNRLCNLREATASQNHFNTVALKTSRTGVKGVVWHGHTKKWQAKITVGGITKSLGYFADKESARAAYVSYAKEVHGQFYNHG